MPTITDFSKVEFVEVYAMHLERPSVIVSGMTSMGQFPQFKFYIDEKTDIDDVVFVLRNHVGCTLDDIGFVTAGMALKHRDGNETISSVFGPKVKENDAYRFKKRQMMQVTIWPKNYNEDKAARFAAMAHGPKPFVKDKK